ncbi:hypothetical protein ACFYVL_04530 [Streptomyces sp. NPDC004111]|uniref:hypothetical protein n=1 Tax=Streptomyces sp. NPDC004111 TaxID=3364690 RepID=UPI0036B66C4C
MIKKLSGALRDRPVRTTLAVLGPVLLVAGGYGVLRLWFGTPYPDVQPVAVEAQLRQRSQEAYDVLGLPATERAATFEASRTDTGSCYYRGWSYLAHFDRPRADVVSFSHSWEVPDVPEAQARRSLEQLRKQMTDQGWQVTDDRDERHHGKDGTDLVALGLWLTTPSDGEDGEEKDRLAVRWNSSGSVLSVHGYAPCGKVPDGYDPNTFGQDTPAPTT